MSVADLPAPRLIRSLAPAAGALPMPVLFANSVALATVVYLGTLDPHNIASFTLPPIVAALHAVAAVALALAALLTLIFTLTQ